MQNDPTYQIRQAVYTALNGNILYDGKKYQVDLYDKLSFPEFYILVRYPQLTENVGTKDPGYIMTGNLQIEVVNKGYAQTHSAEAEMCDIVNDINGYLVDQYLTMTGFAFVVPLFVNGYETQEILTEETTESNIIKKIISYQFIIEQS